MTVTELIIAISIGVFLASVAEAVSSNIIHYFVNKRLRKRLEERINLLQDAVVKEAEEIRDGKKTEEEKI